MLKKIIISALLVSVVGTVSVWLVFFNQTEKVSSENLQTVFAAKEDISSNVTATGTVVPKAGAEVKVGSRISGQLEKLLVEVGSEVKEGEVIAQLQKDDLEAAVDKVEAEVQLALAELSTIKKGARPEEIEKAKANVAQAEASLNLAENELTRHKMLFEQEAVSLQQLQQKEKEWKTAIAVLNVAETELELLKNKYTEEDRLKAEAKVKEAQAALKNVEVQLSYATITSPISGMVASISTQEGETVAAGISAPTFVTIVDLNRLQIDTYVDETDIGKIKLGQKALFMVDAYPNEEFFGTVTAISPKSIIENNVVYYVVTVSIDDTKGLLKPDMTANVIITLEGKTGILTIPSKAIKRENGEKIVYVLNNNQVIKTTVTTGWSDHDSTEIIDGLAEGDEVIISEVSN